MKGRLQCAPNEELKDSDCNKVIWILSSHVHLCMIICVDFTYLWWLIGEEMVVVFYFFCQIFWLLVLKVNLEFKFHHIFIPFKWQFHKILVIWIINKPHRAYNFYDKTKWDFLTLQTWLHRPCSGSVPVSKDWQQEGGGAAEAGRNLCVHHKVFVVNYQRNLFKHHK